LEVRYLFRRHVHFVAGLRIPALSRLAFAEPEAAKCSQLDLLAAMQRVDDALEHRVDNDFGVLLREVGDSRDFLHELRLCHAAAIHSRTSQGLGLSISKQLVESRRTVASTVLVRFPVGPELVGFERANRQSDLSLLG